MICFNCRSQIPDDSQLCPNCGTPIVAENQIGKEIKIRRYQRWVMYLVVIIVFLGMVGALIMVYAQYTSQLTKVTENQKELEQVRANLKNSEQNLANRDSELAQQQIQLTELNQKTTSFQQQVSEQSVALKRFEQLITQLGSANSGVYASLVKFGTGIKNEDLWKFPLADYNLAGPDADRDGLSDWVEIAFGTDPNNPDTDGDSYNDKAELIGGYNPLNTSKLSFDNGFINNHRGMILLQTEANGEAWYVHPQERKLYFLGRPKDAITALEMIGSATASTTTSTTNRIQ